MGYDKFLVFSLVEILTLVKADVTVFFDKFTKRPAIILLMILKT